MCNRTVQFVIKKDKKGVFKFASLQSDTGKTLLKEFNLPQDEIQSIVYIKNERYYLRSDAALEIAKSLGSIWQTAYIFKIIPSFIRNAFYKFIANNRYKWFGKKDDCMMPTPDLQKRFL